MSQKNVCHVCLPLTCPDLFGLFSCDGRSASLMNVCVFLIVSPQAAPVAAEPKAAEAPEPSPETQETGEAKADAVEEVKEIAEASYVMWRSRTLSLCSW